MADDDTIQTQAGAEPSDEQKAAQQAAQQAAMAQEAADKEAAEKAAADRADAEAAAKEAAEKEAAEKAAVAAAEKAAKTKGARPALEAAEGQAEALAPTGQAWLAGEDRLPAKPLADGVYQLEGSRWAFTVRDKAIVGACRSDHLDFAALENIVSVN